MRSIALVLIIIGGPALAACNKHLDTAKADSKLKEWAEAGVAPVKQVTCPRATLKKGNTFECKVDFVSGQSYQIAVEATNNDGDIAFHWVKPITSGEKLASQIAATIKKEQGKDIQLDCGTGLLELPPDGLLCSGTDANGKGHLRVKFDAAAKGLAWTIEP